MSIRSVRALVASAITVAVGVPWLIPSGGPAAVAAAFTVTTVVACWTKPVRLMPRLE